MRLPRALRAFVQNFSWGVPELIAIMLLVTATAVNIGTVRPAQNQLDHLRSELVSKEAQASDRKEQRVNPGNAAAQLGAFYAFFRRTQDFTEWLAQIYDMADRAGIQLKQGDYSRSKPVDVPLEIRQITLPVDGDYAHIRSFAEGVLNVVPVASLDRVSFHRQHSALGQTQAELTFSIYMPSKD